MKTYDVIITPRAKKAVDVIFEYIAEKNPVGAKKWIDAALKTVSDLEIMPERGRLIDKYPDVRQIFFCSSPGGDMYRIIYLVKKESKQVYILTVRHGAGMYEVF